ncbi:hypothetical protein [Xanthomonas graminis]|uniref:Uncharacterized protein n=1 Tax=Xanthomonas graminis pv. arrhenatheri LMG 727 TaxID=1195923 RepID=A0A0K3A1B6_9XANT|nr:hypothetical protein [Xanthomonas translucens]UKE75884.1 hypothetical protein KM317_10140 [Xanthomonas translucens pv. arrhenatheri]CTP91876.1 hypothetical protein XTALMG727_3580 [Xanthomonas translucens pv. arrhenatheri LMG 727]
MRLVSFSGRMNAQRLRKHRGGPTDSCKLKFFGEYTRFDNLSHDSVGAFE